MQKSVLPDSEETPQPPKTSKRKSVSRKGRFPVGITLRGAIRWETRPETAIPLGDATPLFLLYERAEGKLKRNGMLLEAPNRKLSVSWEESRPPELRLPDGNPTGRNRQWEMFVVAGREEPCLVLREKRTIVGYWEKSGTLFLEEGISLSPEDEAFLKRLLEDPMEMLSEHGRELGVCIFCGRRLSDGRSARLGYGKTCAIHFGMPWGAKSVSDTAADKIEVSSFPVSMTPKDHEIGFTVPFGETPP